MFDFNHTPITLRNVNPQSSCLVVTAVHDPMFMCAKYMTASESVHATALY